MRLEENRVRAFIEAIEVTSTFMDDIPPTFAYSRDLDDAVYIKLAIAAGASFIISRDKDLLDLMTSSSLEAADFRIRFPSLRTIDPVSFLHGLDARISPS